MTYEKEPQKIYGIFPTRSNPPHLGTLIALFNAIDEYEKIVVLVHDKPTVLSTEAVVEILQLILNKFTDKFIVQKTDIDFANCSELDVGSFPFDTQKYAFQIITTSRKVYANFTGKNFPYIRIIPKPAGFRDSYQQTAYIRGLVLDQLESSIKYIRK